MTDRMRDWSTDCKYRADWGREATRWASWWLSRLGLGADLASLSLRERVVCALLDPVVAKVSYRDTW